MQAERDAKIREDVTNIKRTLYCEVSPVPPCWSPRSTLLVPPVPPCWSPPLPPCWSASPATRLIPFTSVRLTLRAGEAPLILFNSSCSSPPFVLECACARASTLMRLHVQRSCVVHADIWPYFCMCMCVHAECFAVCVCTCVCVRGRRGRECPAQVQRVAYLRLSTKKIGACHVVLGLKLHGWLLADLPQAVRESCRA